MEGIIIPRTKRGQATFDRIVTQAEKLFHEQGFHVTTITDIVTASEVAAGTFYLYFLDKLSLYRHVLMKYSHEIRAAIAIATKGLSHREEIEREGLFTFIKFARDHPYAYTIIWQSLQVDRQLFENYYLDFALRYTRGLQHALDEDQINPVDLRTASFVLMGIANFVGLQVIYLNNKQCSDEEIYVVVDEVMKILKTGLLK